MASTAKQQVDVIDITDDGPPVSQQKTVVVKRLACRPARPKILNKSASSPVTSTSATSASSTTTSAITLPQEDNTHIEKRCENPDCAAPTLISLVPTRPTPQFIHDPTVVPEPILVNGYTTVFEVGGITAKVSELSTVRGPDGKIRYKSQKPVYRIVPNTHAHIVNYVIIDAEGETLRKIKQNDPPTIKKLLESQKNSAEQLLEKLIGGKKDEVTITRTTATPTGQPQRTVVRTPSNVVGTSTPTAAVPSAPTITTPIIASVSSGVPQVSAAVGAIPVPTVSVQAVTTPDVTATSTLERMQSELRELRETVKLLTEQKRASTGSTDESDPKKRKAS